MNKRRVIGVVVGIAAATVLLGSLSLKQREPTFEGRSLSQWLTRAYYHGTGSNAEAEKVEARRAIQKIGTNALPYLIEWLKNEKPSWRDRLSRALPRKIAGTKFVFRLLGAKPKPSLYGDPAALGFALLGPQAAPAIPDLARMLQAPSDYESERAARALVLAGEPGIAALITALSDPRIPNRYMIIILIPWDEKLAGNRPAAVAALIQCLNDHDPHVSWIAAYALGEINLYSDRVVPALVGAFQNPRPDLRAVAAVSLGKLQTSARLALPALRELLNDPDPEVRQSASNALGRIESATSTKKAIH